MLGYRARDTMQDAHMPIVLISKIMNAEDFQGLLSVPNEHRDISWKKKFYESIQSIPLSIQEEFLGPDRFPYIRVVLKDNDAEGEIFIKDLLDKCLEEGKGVACFNIDKSLVWVFSYGALRSLKERGNFEVFEDESRSNNDTVEKMPVSGMPIALERRTVGEKRNIFLGQPSEEFFSTICTEGY